MSIIYDALKKIERSSLKRLVSNKKENKKNKSQYLIFVFLVIAGVFIAKFGFDFFKVSSNKNTVDEARRGNFTIEPKIVSTAITEQSVPEGTYPQEVQERRFSTLILNGVFDDGVERYAIINNRVLKEGEFIEGAKLVRILSKTVELELEGKTIKLKISN